MTLTGSLVVRRFAKCHEVFEDGSHVDGVRIVRVLSLCHETEGALAEPSDAFPIFAGLLGERLALREDSWIPALSELLKDCWAHLRGSEPVVVDE
jgi:hypothetical protein